MIPTVNSYKLQKNLPNSQLILYPDSAHASLFQYATLFVDYVCQFLSSEAEWPG
jgi:hypothetical protein